MIRNLIALVALALAALAAPVANCADRTLDRYIALGSDACQLGAYRVFDFQEISPSFGADPIASSAVSIMAATGANFGSLAFSASVRSITTALEPAFLYSIAGPIFLGGLTLDQATGSGAGSATSGQATVTFATPEPGSVLFAGSALAGLIVFKRRRPS